MTSALGDRQKREERGGEKQGTWMKKENEAKSRRNRKRLTHFFDSFIYLKHFSTPKMNKTHLQ